MKLPKQLRLYGEGELVGSKLDYFDDYVASIRSSFRGTTTSRPQSAIELTTTEMPKKPLFKKP